MTLDEFYVYYVGYRATNHLQREGQALFNALREQRPDLARGLQSTHDSRPIGRKLDPFNNEKNIPRAWSWIVEHWDDA